MELYRRLIPNPQNAYLCVNEGVYRSVWLASCSISFRLEKLIDPNAKWLPILTKQEHLLKDGFEHVDSFDNLQECYEYLSMLQLMED